MFHSFLLATIDYVEMRGSRDSPVSAPIFSVECLGLQTCCSVQLYVCSEDSNSSPHASVVGS